MYNLFTSVAEEFHVFDIDVIICTGPILYTTALQVKCLITLVAYDPPVIVKFIFLFAKRTYPDFHMLCDVTDAIDCLARGYSLTATPRYLY